MGSDVNKNSKDIMHLIVSGSIGAEIGVWKGNTSKEFLKRKVKELHLIDPWSTEPYKTVNVAGMKAADGYEFDDYLKRYKKVVGSDKEKDFEEYYDKIYRSVVDKFKENKEVVIHRTTSSEWFKTIEPNYFDWIYVDGSHDYEEVLEDLNSCLVAIKEGGFIIGDDYDWGRIGHKPGVKKAVDEFVKENSLELNKHGKFEFSIKL